MEVRAGWSQRPGFLPGDSGRLDLDLGPPATAGREGTPGPPLAPPHFQDGPGQNETVPGSLHGCGGS